MQSTYLPSFLRAGVASVASAFLLAAVVPVSAQDLDDEDGKVAPALKERPRQASVPVMEAADFDLEAVAALVRDDLVKDAAELEQVINEDNGINNVDIDKDGFVDQVIVQEIREGDDLRFDFVAVPSSSPVLPTKRVVIAQLHFDQEIEAQEIEVVAVYTDRVVEYHDYVYTYTVVHPYYVHSHRHTFCYWAYQPHRTVVVWTYTPGAYHHHRRHTHERAHSHRQRYRERRGVRPLPRDERYANDDNMPRPWEAPADDGPVRIPERGNSYQVKPVASAAATPPVARVEDSRGTHQTNLRSADEGKARVDARPQHPDAATRAPIADAQPIATNGARPTGAQGKVVRVKKDGQAASVDDERDARPVQRNAAREDDADLDDRIGRSSARPVESSSERTASTGGGRTFTVKKKSGAASADTGSAREVSRSSARDEDDDNDARTARTVRAKSAGSSARVNDDDDDDDRKRTRSTNARVNRDDDDNDVRSARTVRSKSASSSARVNRDDDDNDVRSARTVRAKSASSSARVARDDDDRGSSASSRRVVRTKGSSSRSSVASSRRPSRDDDAGREVSRSSREVRTARVARSSSSNGTRFESTASRSSSRSNVSSIQRGSSSGSKASSSKKSKSKSKSKSSRRGGKRTIKLKKN